MTSDRVQAVPAESVRWQPVDGGDVRAVAQARAWAIRMLPQVLHTPAKPGLEDDVELLLSELASNAVRHAGGIGEVRLRRRGEWLRITVVDCGPQLPVVRPPAAGDQDNGRGMLLVDALAAAWGVDSHPDDGKDVWLELRV